MIVLEERHARTGRRSAQIRVSDRHDAVADDSAARLAGVDQLRRNVDGIAGRDLESRRQRRRHAVNRDGRERSPRDRRAVAAYDPGSRRNRHRQVRDFGIGHRDGGGDIAVDINLYVVDRARIGPVNLRQVEDVWHDIGLPGDDGGWFADDRVCFRRRSRNVGGVNHDLARLTGRAWRHAWDEEITRGVSRAGRAAHGDQSALNRLLVRVEHAACEYRLAVSAHHRERAAGSTRDRRAVYGGQSLHGERISRGR
ncbi:MAG: hypothetical protein JMDDDDMK_00455 [Acidobacteria bacterium]|nr:hypothetical protein [Acidobacteriota bacterium]